MRIIIIDNPDATAIELILKSGFHVYVEGSIPEVAEVPKVESKPTQKELFSVDSDEEIVLNLLREGKKTGQFLTNVFQSRLCVAESTARRKLGVVLANLVHGNKIRRRRQDRFAVWECV